jgi:hypothetical protein
MRPHHKSSTSNISQAPQWRPKNTQNNHFGKPGCFTRASSSSNIMHLMGKRCGGIPGKGRRRRTSARRWGSRPIGRARHREASGKLTLDRIEQKGNRAGFRLAQLEPPDRGLRHAKPLGKVHLALAQGGAQSVCAGQIVHGFIKTQNVLSCQHASCCSLT